MDIRPVLTKDELESAYVVITELRTTLSRHDFGELYSQARKADGYTLIGAFDRGKCIGVMGYRTLYDFVHGKHLYIDDLVTAEAYRSKGVGKSMLEFAKSEASRLGCANLRLCTGVANEGAKKFYEREGWQQRSVVFKLKTT